MDTYGSEHLLPNRIHKHHFKVSLHPPYTDDARRDHTIDLFGPFVGRKVRPDSSGAGGGFNDDSPPRWPESIGIFIRIVEFVLVERVGDLLEVYPVSQ